MSGILLDTHVLYWWMTADRRLGTDTLAHIASADARVSVASQWEMVLKQGRGKLPLPDGDLSHAIERAGFRLVPIRPEHVDAVRRLPAGIDDPFDRLLLATAIIENLVLVTRYQPLLAFAGKVTAAAVREA